MDVIGSVRAAAGEATKARQAQVRAATVVGTVVIDWEKKDTLNSAFWRGAVTRTLSVWLSSTLLTWPLTLWAVHQRGRDPVKPRASLRQKFFCLGSGVSVHSNQCLPESTDDTADGATWTCVSKMPETPHKELTQRLTTVTSWVRLHLCGRSYCDGEPSELKV